MNLYPIKKKIYCRFNQVNSADTIKAPEHVMEEQVAPPVHVAIIMDGNGRWAKSRKLAKVAGHKRGADSIKTAVKSAIAANVRYLTLYGFSSENWNRPTSEISELMGLLRFYLKREVPTLHEEGVSQRLEYHLHHAFTCDPRSTRRPLSARSPPSSTTTRIPRCSRTSMRAP